MLFYSLFLSNRIEDAISWISALIDSFNCLSSSTDAHRCCCRSARAPARSLILQFDRCASPEQISDHRLGSLSCLFVRNGSWWEVYLLFSCCSWHWARLWWARGKRERSAAVISWRMSSSGSPPSTSTAARSSTGTASETWVSPPSVCFKSVHYFGCLSTCKFNWWNYLMNCSIVRVAYIFKVSTNTF